MKYWVIGIVGAILLYGAMGALVYWAVSAEQDYEERVEKLLAENNVADVEGFEQTLEDAGYIYTIDDDGDYRIMIEFDDKRSQIIYISGETFNFDNTLYRDVWSIGYLSNEAFDELLANYLLIENSDMIIGAWEMQEWDGQQLAIFRSSIVQVPTEQALHDSIRAVSISADEMEKDLMGTDDF